MTPQNEQQAVLTRSEVVTSGKETLDKLLSIEGGLLLMDKGYGISSFSVVNSLRKVLSSAAGVKRVKVGHAGTLDPLATGLMILGSKRCTRQLTTFLGESKEYRTRIRLGVTSPSFDLETPISIGEDPIDLSPITIHEVLSGFVGVQSQMPPQYSAIKQNGKPVYLKARKGREVTLSPREVEIYSIADIVIELPYISFTVRCSKGTYIRSLAADIGHILGVGAVLTDLRRSAIGDFRVEQAITVADMNVYLNPQQ